MVQGKEPAHFRALFQGSMVVHAGGVASGFRNNTQGDSYDTDGISLYHVKGATASTTCAVQVPEQTRYLCSGDCFVLLTPGEVCGHDPFFVLFCLFSQRLFNARVCVWGGVGGGGGVFCARVCVR